MAEEIGANAPGRLNYRQRKVSFSDALSKLTPKPFTRRRTAPDFFNTSSSSSSYTKIEPQKRPQQRQPQSQQDPSTSYRVSRSASLFNGLNSLVPRLTIPRNHKESDLTAPKSVRPPRKINHRFSQPASFLNFKAPEQEATEPLIPKKKPGTQIIHRALMQPISNPPLPRRSTMGNLTRNPSTQIPSYMRPTSSSAARRNSGPAVLKNRAPTTTATPNKPRSRPSGRNPPAMNFSLPSSSRVQEATIQESPAPITSPKVPTTSPKIISEQSGQSERLKLTVNSTYSFEELLRTLTPEDEIAEFEAERAKSKPAVIEGPSDDSPPTEEPSDDPPPTKEPSDNPTPTEEPGDEPPADEETGDASESIYVANPFQVCLLAPLSSRFPPLSLVSAKPLPSPHHFLSSHN